MTVNSPAHPPAYPHVALYATCLMDLYRPNVGFSAVHLLEAAGCRVSVPRGQTCCGQPAYNSGDRATARALALRVLREFEDFDHVVLPSGTCGAMMRAYPALFAYDPDLQARARALADRTFELTAFLVDVMGMTSVDARLNGVATYHDSCSGLRELGVRDQPRRLLSTVQGLELNEMTDAQVCCGFGGLFSVKYPDISGRMVADKGQRVSESGARFLLGGDLGCLLNIAGRLRHEGSDVRVFHVAEVLAGRAEGRAIGEGKE
ncbi:MULTISPECIES: (Fe-S)-binding protein [unclassified Ectothiorhodospira]|uniref:(Fe-S)-binding protein n=1 Tax=unclassified Ectothiorhodospira TaxID=2684909 RepID=UPI001EE99DA5|nr:MULTISPECIES: (Fe-S)-binding protein [unclassified Ectothiorhodospira]MCG5514644.1 (Fe-S)-binding protein [Ectothiorhodospira sp. 9100]MCG5517982.1 (Fe-S)-binding protein [Ectothiorhodospira sp. 9905]